MKKFLVSLLVAVVLFTGCSGNSDETNKKISDLERELASKTEQLADLENKYAALEKEKNLVEKEYADYREMVRDREGLPQGENQRIPKQEEVKITASSIKEMIGKEIDLKGVKIVITDILYLHAKDNMYADKDELILLMDMKNTSSNNQDVFDWVFKISAFQENDSVIKELFVVNFLSTDQFKEREQAVLDKIKPEGTIETVAGFRIEFPDELVRIEFKDYHHKVQEAFEIDLKAVKPLEE